MYEPKQIYTKMVPATDTHFSVPYAPVFNATSNQVLLIHADGVDASTSFPDAAGRHVITANGAAQVDTAQSVFGGASALFDGAAGTYLSISGSNDFTFSSDYTIDLRVRPTVSIAGLPILFHSDPSVSLVNRIFMQINATGNVIFSINGTAQITTVAAISLDAWAHIALIRAANVTRLFINGSQDPVTYTGGETIPAGSAFVIGARGDGGVFNFNGWIDEFRILNGYAAWTGSFSSPTAAYLP